MANKNKTVTVHVHKEFFDNVFEPGRKSLQNKLGVNFTQSKYTEYLAKAKVKMTYPKRSNLFAPKKKRGGREYSLSF